MVKATIMRMTLHVAAADDFPAYAQLVRHARMRTLRNAATRSSTRSASRAELSAWLREPRTNEEIRERVRRLRRRAAGPELPLLYARTLLPLTFLPPAGHWRDTTRNARFVLDPRPLPDPEDAGALVLTRYLEAFGPAAKRDVGGLGRRRRSATSRGSASKTVSYRDETGRELLDLPGRAAPARRHEAPAALPRQLGPAAAGLRRPRPDHPARGPAAEAHALRRHDADRRRPRRRQLDDGRRRA